MLMINDIPQALEHVGVSDIKRSGNRWDIPGIYILDFLQHHSDYTRSSYNPSRLKRLKKKAVHISAAYEAVLENSAIIYGIRQIGKDPGHIISILAYSGSTQHEDFFSPFQAPYAASASIDGLTYVTLSMPFVSCQASDITPLLVSWPKAMMDTAARQKDMENYLMQSIENLVSAYERIRFPIPDMEQITMAARLTSIHYMMQESVKR